MSLNSLFIKIYRKLTLNRLLNSGKKEPDIDEWIKFINSIPEPTSDLDRSYAKYQCRMYYFPLYYKVIANLSAIFLFLLSIPIFMKKSIIKNQDLTKKEGFVLLKSKKIGYEDIIPNELFEEYGEEVHIIDKPDKKDGFLNDESKKILKQSIKKYPLGFYFNYSLFRELCIYSKILCRYSTKAIAIYLNERNIAGPILSEMCEQNGVDLVLFMHGDRTFNLIEGFQRYTKYYIWDEHYIDLFHNSLRCPREQFEIYIPNKLQGICKPKSNSHAYDYYATYYFGGESDKRIKKVAEAFKLLKNQGKVCKVRPHPRWSNCQVINKEFEKFTIEDPHEITIADSLECSEYTISLNSTVLSEAYHCGKKIVIDDYSEPERYENLKKRKYIMLYKEHKLLSELIKE